MHLPLPPPKKNQDYYSFLQMTKTLLKVIPYNLYISVIKGVELVKQEKVIALYTCTVNTVRVMSAVYKAAFTLTLFANMATFAVSHFPAVYTNPAAAFSLHFFNLFWGMRFHVSV